jgi:hypothetical protein
VLSQEPLTRGERARAELLRDPARTNQAIAELVGASRGTVARARQQLASAGLILGRTGHRVPTPAIPQLPSRPALDGALCATAPDPSLWASSHHADRQAAIAVCLACPVRAECASWSLSLPRADTAIYGGMTTTERIAARHQLAEAG